MKRHSRWLVAVLAAAALVAAACGGGDDDSASTSSDGSRGPGAVTSTEDVQSATIQIVAKGSFAQPAGSLAAYEEVEGAGSGSGFIVTPDGIAITNNHVVTGAATLEVFVGGDDEPVKAKVLGVSECSDLAVIDLEGDGYPYLEWYEGEPSTGLEVITAGFPLGDPEFTMTRGIVSKAKADGDTNWASVESVIEHDAAIQPGNSGGPLVSVKDARVVAVNYAGGDPGTGTSQYFAISAALAKPLAEQLRDGDVGSLGVNGTAVVDEESGISGIWVSSVDTNSPAGELGLKGGDIIEKIEGLAGGADGTMKDYCDILDSHEAGDKLSVQVLRFEEQVRLTGQFNGEPLTESESFAAAIEEEAGGLATGTEYSEYVTVTDDSGTLSVQVPAEWADVDGRPITIGDQPYPNVEAAPDRDAFRSSWSEPGLSLSAVGPAAGSPDELLAALAGSASAECTDAGDREYSDGLYTGRMHILTDCGGTGAATVLIAAQPDGGEFTALVLVQILSEADAAVVDQIIATFIANP